MSLRLLTLIPFILAVNWLMTTIVLKFQEIIDFFIVQFCLEKHAEFQEHRNLTGGLKVGIVSPEISCSTSCLGVDII